MDFHAFLDEVNETRRAVIEDGEPLDITAWTPDFTDQNHTFTDEAIETLLTRRDMVDYLPLEQAREDLDVFFTLLRTTYGAYEYFGGDEVFEELKAEAIQRLEDSAGTGSMLVRLATALYGALEGTVLDGHFTIAGSHLVPPLYTYYVPDVYISDPAGLSEDYVKPTIGPDGAITYGFFAMSEDGSDLPDSLGGYELDWTLCEPVGRGNFVFAEKEYRGIPTLQSRYMSADTPEEEAQLERFASCGGEYADVRRAEQPRRQRLVVYGMVQWVDRTVCSAPQVHRTSVQPDRVLFSGLSGRGHGNLAGFLPAGPLGEAGRPHLPADGCRHRLRRRGCAA